MYGVFVEEFAQHEGDVEAAIDAGFGDVLWGVLAEGATLGPIYICIIIRLKTRSEGGRVKEGRRGHYILLTKAGSTPTKVAARIPLSSSFSTSSRISFQSMSTPAVVEEWIGVNW